MIKLFLNWMLSLILSKADETFLKDAIEKLRVKTYKPMKLDQLNSKLIRPVMEIDGVQYYEFVNLADMPDSRFVHFTDFIREFNMGMTREELLSYFQEIAKANDKDEKSRIGSLCFMAMDTVANCTPVESMFNIASLLYFDKDEDLKCWDADYNEAKIKTFKGLPVQKRAFFLTALYERSLQASGGKSEKDIVDYLNKSAVKLKQYARIRSGHYA